MGHVLAEMKNNPAGSDDPADGRTLKCWLGGLCKQLREENGVKRQQIAAVADVDQSTLSRFESGQTYPEKLDRIIATYAYMCNVEDGREIWQRAVDDFMRRGAAPFLGPLTHQQSAVLLAQDAQRLVAQAEPPTTSPDVVESQDRPISKLKRRRAR